MSDEKPLDDAFKCKNDLDCETNNCDTKEGLCKFKNIGEKCNQGYQCATGNCMRLSEVEDYTCQEMLQDG